MGSGRIPDDKGYSAAWLATAGEVYAELCQLALGDASDRISALATAIDLIDGLSGSPGKREVFLLVAIYVERIIIGDASRPLSRDEKALMSQLKRRMPAG
jgi:hypothetical protein